MNEMSTNKYNIIIHVTTVVLHKTGNTGRTIQYMVAKGLHAESFTSKTGNNIQFKSYGSANNCGKGVTVIQFLSPVTDEKVFAADLQQCSYLSLSNIIAISVPV